MNHQRFRNYVDGRLFEWAMSIGMFFLSIEMWLWPTTINGSAFRWLVVVVPPSGVALVMFAAGLARITALIINGRSHVYGPMARAFGAMAGAVMWGQFTLALIMPYLVGDTKMPSPGIPFWFTFVFAELYVCYRATFDVKQ